MTRRLIGLPPALAALGRPVVMAVLNVTPDSFSDGGRWSEVGPAVDHGRRLAADGADLVDVGGESTRPGAGRVTAAEELRRVVPVVAALVADGITVSVDTMRAVVAVAAVEAGAVIVNDVSGGLADPDMLGAVAGLSCPYVAMHWRTPSSVMARHSHYDDPVGEVRAELAARVSAAVQAGIEIDRIIVDPGIGFAKDADHNWAVLAGLDAIAELGRPVLVGVSRKRFIGSLLAGPDGDPRPVERRDVASAALAALLAARGVWGIRAHDASATHDAVLAGHAWAAAERRALPSSLTQVAR